MAKRKCELCGDGATMYCDSDEASLCWTCDEKVHSANFLVAKHSRTLLCHACCSPTPWTASGPNLCRTVSVCRACLHRAQAQLRRHGGQIRQTNVHDFIDSQNTDYEDSGSSSSDDEYDDDVEEEEGENQVVPWSATSSPASSPPPQPSSSSGDEGAFSARDGGGTALSSALRKRLRDDDDQVVITSS